MTSTLSNVSPVHGGLSEPVNRIDPSATSETGLPTVEVQDVDHTTLYRIADGTLSPLEGPMGEKDYNDVLAKGAIERNGGAWAWTIPVILPVTDAEAALCAVGAKISLVHGGSAFGTLEVDSVFDWDKDAFIKTVYRTERTDHPGARLWTSDERTKLVGGTICLLPSEDTRSFAEWVMSPNQTRALVAEQGWEQSIAFQTRNPLHRAHEYALVYGAETILRANGKRTGVVLNPLVGQLKGDDVPAATRMETYEALVANRLLGDGDKDEALWSDNGQDLNDNLKLVGLDMRMYYGGPAEAVMHAIYRQNLGFSHFIIGRKHADAPFDDGDAIWGDFDAQEVFENLGGALSIQTVNVGFAAYFEEIGRVGLMEENKENTSVFISGTKVRAQLVEGENPDPRIMRETTAAILVEYYKSKGE
ncbi:MAG: sulfate adenylyltransferase [Planctomycetota bacterium]|jgi:sulfate adenylyltransferase|nr:sulfate adenylyltransferase [Psychrobacter sp.]MDP6740581.1 sulfate adenylyltransferase [Planctomycetota bacterium]MDP6937232.1 sulfate adenylyltransferase [Planctomycetota bacterium]